VGAVRIAPETLWISHVDPEHCH